MKWIQLRWIGFALIGAAIVASTAAVMVTRTSQINDQPFVPLAHKDAEYYGKKDFQQVLEHGELRLIVSTVCDHVQAEKDLVGCVHKISGIPNSKTPIQIAGGEKLELLRWGPDFLLIAIEEGCCGGFNRYHFYDKAGASFGYTEANADSTNLDNLHTYGGYPFLLLTEEGSEFESAASLRLWDFSQSRIDSTQVWLQFERTTACNITLNKVDISAGAISMKLMLNNCDRQGEILEVKCPKKKAGYFCG